MQINFVGTQRDFVDAQKTHGWRRYSPRRARFQEFVQIFLGLTLIADAIFSYRWHDTSRTVIQILFGLYLALASRVIAPLLFIRAYRRRQTGDSNEVFLTITEESLVYDFPGNSHTELEWQVIKGMVESRTSVLLYITSVNFLTIPLRAISSEQYAELKALLRAKKIPHGCPKPAKG